MINMIKKIATIFILLFLCSVSFSYAEEAVKKYPPYPDVWGIELPVSESVDYAALRVVRMPDGDYMVVYAKAWVKLKEKEKAKYVGQLVFSGASKDFKTDDEYNKFFEQMREEGRILRFHAPPAKRKIITEEDRIKRLADSSSYGRGISVGGGDVRTEDCNPLDGYLVMLNKDGKTLSKKKLLYVYSKPMKKEVPLTCEGTETYRGKFYYEKVHFLEEMAYYSLEDDTFLFVGFLKNQSPPSVVVIRFARDFETKSDLINKKVFVVDEEVYEKLTYKPDLDNQVKVDQAMYNYLIKIKKNNKKGVKK